MQYGFQMFTLLCKLWFQVWAREPDGLTVRANQVCEHFSARDRLGADTCLVMGIVVAFKGSSQISSFQHYETKQVEPNCMSSPRHGFPAPGL